jgi:hypothetical protein
MIMEPLSVVSVYDRVNRSIGSSSTLLQLETAERLVELFCRQSNRPELNEKLRMEFQRRAQLLHYFDWKNFRDFGFDAA